MRKYLGFIAVMALVVAACSSAEPTTPTDDGGTVTTTGGATEATEVGGSGEPIVFASSLPLTGDFAAVGAKHADGYKFCVAEINAAGGLLGRSVKLIVEDNRSDTEVVVNQTERFINVDNADILFGTFSSLLGYPASSIAQQNGMVYPLPSSGAVRVYERGYDNLFYFQQLPAELTGSSIVDLVEYYTSTGLIDEAPKTAAIVAADDFFAGAIANGFVGGDISFPDSDEIVSLAPGYVAELGMDLVFDEVWPEGFSDWVTLANSIASTEPDFIAMTTASPAESIALIRALKTVGYDAPLIYSSQGTQSEFGEELGEAANGIVVHSVWAPEANWEGLIAGETYTNQDFIDNFTESFGHAPDEDEAIPFALCQGMEQAIRAVGSTDNAAIIEWLHARTAADPVRTIMGPFVWDERGIATERAFLVNQWQDGELVVVYPVDEFPGTGNLVYPRPPFG